MPCCSARRQSTRCYWPGGRCPATAPLADGVGWTVDAADLVGGTHGTDTATYSKATKTIGTVTIVGTVLNPSTISGFRFPGVTAATSGSPATSIGVREYSGADPNMEFAISVPQPQVQMKVEDIDSPQGSGKELVRLKGGGRTNPAREADSVQRYKPAVGPSPNPNGNVYYTAGGDYGVNNADENALLLVWRDNPWGDGTNGADPVQVQYVNTTGANRGSYFDFGGYIFQEECTITPRRAVLTRCCGDGDTPEWRDVETGEVLSADDAATLGTCAS